MQNSEKATSNAEELAQRVDATAENYVTQQSNLSIAQTTLTAFQQGQLRR